MPLKHRGENPVPYTREKTNLRRLTPFKSSIKTTLRHFRVTPSHDSYLPENSQIRNGIGGKNQTCRNIIIADKANAGLARGQLR